jgi:hypothetical protein
MTRLGITLFRLVPPSLLGSAIVLAASAGAQEERGFAVGGYITTVRLPTGFDVNGQHVTLGPDTRYGLKGKRPAPTARYGMLFGWERMFW